MIENIESLQKKSKQINLKVGKVYKSLAPSELYDKFYEECKEIINYLGGLSQEEKVLTEISRTISHVELDHIISILDLIQDKILLEENAELVKLYATAIVNLNLVKSKMFLPIAFKDLCGDIFLLFFNYLNVGDIVKLRLLDKCFYDFINALFIPSARCNYEIPLQEPIVNKSQSSWLFLGKSPFKSTERNRATLLESGHKVLQLFALRKNRMLSIQSDCKATLWENHAAVQSLELAQHFNIQTPEEIKFYAKNFEVIELDSGKLAITLKRGSISEIQIWDKKLNEREVYLDEKFIREDLTCDWLWPLRDGTFLVVNILSEQKDYYYSYAELIFYKDPLKKEISNTRQKLAVSDIREVLSISELTHGDIIIRGKRLYESSSLLLALSIETIFYLNFKDNKSYIYDCYEPEVTLSRQSSDDKAVRYCDDKVVKYTDKNYKCIPLKNNMFAWVEVSVNNYATVQQYFNITLISSKKNKNEKLTVCSGMPIVKCLDNNEVKQSATIERNDIFDAAAIAVTVDNTILVANNTYIGSEIKIYLEKEGYKRAVSLSCQGKLTAICATSDGSIIYGDDKGKLIREQFTPITIKFSNNDNQDIAPESHKKFVLS